MSSFFLFVLVALLYLLHQDFWFWRQARPLVFGLLPVGLFYHAAFTAACSLLMWVLVGRAWPAHLEPDAAAAPGGRDAPSPSPDRVTTGRGSFHGGPGQA